MSNTTKKTIIAAIVQKTGVKPAEARRAFETVLRSIKLALVDGKQIDLGKKLGKLKVVTRNTVRRIDRYQKNGVATLEDVHKKHPKTVSLLGGEDLSENPQPTIVHKKATGRCEKKFRNRQSIVASPNEIKRRKPI